MQNISKYNVLPEERKEKTFGIGTVLRTIAYKKAINAFCTLDGQIRILQISLVTRLLQLHLILQTKQVLKFLKNK